MCWWLSSWFWHFLIFQSHHLFLPCGTAKRRRATLVNAFTSSSPQCVRNEDFTYSEFYKLALAISDIGSSFLKSNASSEYCSTCSFIGECSISSLLCPITNDLRMVEDPRFSCSNEIYIFYAPGAALMFLSFTLGVPSNNKERNWIEVILITIRLVLFYRIISTSIKFLDQIPIMTKDADARWILAVSYTNNSCKGLYGMFDYAWYGD